MTESFPRRFGRYTLVDHLAQGGMGALYLAYQGEPGLEKLCVVKTVLRELADKEYVARFRDEAKVVVRLSHGNLVPVFDAGSVDGELYIAMEYVDGRDLRAVWNKCAEKGIPFPVDVAVYIIKELCRGLHHAHTVRDLKLVHRDVSPPNVLLAYSGEVRLTDFGLANSSLKLQYTMPGIIYGKVSYMSPEQARGEPLDGRADIYAAGVILWELLTGRQLFPNTDGHAMERVRSPDVPRPSLKAARVPPPLDPLVMKALAPDVQSRYPDAEALRAALAGYLAREAPTIDTARVAGFLRQLFDDDIERDRRRREQLVVESRQKLAQRTLEPQSSRVAPPPSATDAPPPSSRPMAPPSSSRPPRPQQQLLVLDSGGIESAVQKAIDGPLDQSAGLVDTLIDGRYRVLRLIGEGGMGRVYEAEHVEIGKRVAIKVLHPTWSRFPELVARFRREARAASRIGHPNIIDVTDSGTTEGGAVYIVMEYLEGADLAEVIHREKALGLERAIHIATQLARALQAAHQAGVIHRDLKPENVFLIARPGQADFVKVLDFGIARNLEGDAGAPRLTMPNMAMGTPQYMSPEQAAGKPADARSDIYGVGVILYEMLVGQPPHQGQTNEEVIHKKLTEVPLPVNELRDDVSVALSDCVAAALARDPSLRQQMMSELADELERCRPDRRRATDRVRTTRSQGPSWAAPVAIAGSVLLVLSGLGALWLRGRPDPEPAATAPVAGRPGKSLGGEVRTERSGPLAVTSGSPSTDAGGATAPAGARAGTPPEGAVTAVDPARPARGEPAAEVRPRAVVRPPPAASVTTAEARRMLGEAAHLLRDHKLTQAERAYQHVLDSGVEVGAATTGLAKVAFESGSYKAAVARGERAVQLGGGVEAHRVLGDAYLKDSRAEAAIREYKAVLRLKPRDDDARRHLDSLLARPRG